MNLKEVRPVEVTDVPRELSVLHLPPDTRNFVQYETDGTSPWGNQIVKPIQRYASVINASQTLWEDERFRNALIRERAREMYKQVADEGFYYVLSPLKVEYTTSTTSYEKPARNLWQRAMLALGLREPEYDEFTTVAIRMEVRVA